MEQNFLTIDLSLLARLYRVYEWGDLGAARRWSAYLLVYCETCELRDKGHSRSAMFTRLVTDWEVDCLREWRTLSVGS